MSSINKSPHSKVYKRSVSRSCRVATDHCGMSLRTHFQPGATIVQVHGAVEAANAARLSDYVDDLASTARPLILDLRLVDLFTAEGYRTLIGLADKCRRTGARWALVPSDAVDRLLQTANGDHRLPVATSVADALQQLTSAEPAWPQPQQITARESTRC